MFSVYKMAAASAASLALVTAATAGAGAEPVAKVDLTKLAKDAVAAKHTQDQKTNLKTACSAQNSEPGCLAKALNGPEAQARQQRILDNITRPVVIVKLEAAKASDTRQR